jgi:hypothetical protein
MIFHLHRVSLETNTETRSELMGQAEEKQKELIGWLMKVRDELREAENSGGTSDGARSYWAYSRNMRVFNLPFCENDRGFES